MFFLGLAVDYDGTIAQDGHVTDATVDALTRLRKSGRRLLLVTGRRLEPLIDAFPQYKLFDRLIIENGAAIHSPADNRTETLADPPNAQLIELLRKTVSTPIEVGRAIIAGWEPDQDNFLRAVHQLGLEMQIIFNKGALMLLPTGVNKASGLRRAAQQLKIRPSALVGVGDAENDHSFLAICGCSCATANALPSLKEAVDIVAPEDHGSGVQWLIGQLLLLDRYIIQHDRHSLPIGHNSSGDDFKLPRHEGNVLIVGPSRSGKSSLATVICEAAFSRDLGFAVIDPEGDYTQLDGAVTLDFARPEVDIADCNALLRLQVNPVVMLRGVRHDKRKRYFALALRMILNSKAQTGHPDLLIIDEAHEGLPPSTPVVLGDETCSVILTLSPELISSKVLRTVTTVIAVGPEKLGLLQKFASITGVICPEVHQDELSKSAVAWHVGRPPVGFDPNSPIGRHVRHAGKYAAGDLGQERSFYFRGAGDQHLVPARNLFEFMVIARKLPPEVWQHHFKNHDVSRWFRDVIRDAELADRADRIVEEHHGDIQKDLDEVCDFITERYCVPPAAVSSF